MASKRENLLKLKLQEDGLQRRIDLDNEEYMKKERKRNFKLGNMGQSRDDVTVEADSPSIFNS